MSTETRIVAANVSGTALNLNEAIFRESCNKTAIQKFGSLFPGVGYGAVYKILQRIYKFGGQPVLKDSLGKKYGVEFENRFGHQNGRTMIAAVSGSLIGIGEVFLLPLDALKVKAQTAPEQLKGRGVVDIFAKEGFGLYRGAGWTAARVRQLALCLMCFLEFRTQSCFHSLQNAPGSFALFGGNAAAKSYMGVGEDGQRATWAQDALSSAAGAIASITVAQPLDVIKVSHPHEHIFNILFDFLLNPYKLFLHPWRRHAFRTDHSTLQSQVYQLF